MFTHEEENPLIDGIEIVKTGSSASPPGADNVDNSIIYQRLLSWADQAEPRRHQAA